MCNHSPQLQLAAHQGMGTTGGTYAAMTSYLTPLEQPGSRSQALIPGLLFPGYCFQALPLAHILSKAVCVCWGGERGNEAAPRVVYIQ